MVLEKALENSLDCKDSKPVNPKGNQSWIFIEGLMLKLKPQYYGHLMWRADSLKRPPDAGKDWRQEEKGTGKSGVLQSMGLQRIRHDLVTEQQMGRDELRIFPWSKAINFYLGGTSSHKFWCVILSLSFCSKYFLILLWIFLWLMGYLYMCCSLSKHSGMF